MKSIKNFTLKEFLEQNEDLIISYMPYLEALKPIETKRSLWDCSLSVVEDCKTTLINALDDELIKIVSIIQKQRKSKILELPILTFFGLLKSIEKQLEDVLSAEQNALVSEVPNIKWEQVNGSESLAKFGIFNTLDKLANGDILKYDNILQLPYSKVFTKLYLDKTKSDLEYEMSRIKTQN